MEAVAAAYEWSDLAFIGRVVDRRPTLGRIAGLEGEHPVRWDYLFVVDEGFKGAVAGDTVSVWSGSGRGDCGYLFGPRERAVVYGRGPGEGASEGKYYTGMCTRTTSVWGPRGLTWLEEERVRLRRASVGR